MGIISSLEQNDLIKNYKPTPQDGKFGADFITAMHSHAPLTFLQKSYIFVISMPGPSGWKLPFFNSIYGLIPTSVNPLVIIAIGMIFLIVLFCLVKHFGRKLLIKDESLVFLEVIYPSTNDKTPYATEQFFALLHALARNNGFAHKLFGHRKKYSFEIVASKERGIRYILAVPKNESSVIEKSLLSFIPGLRINGIEDYLPDNFTEIPKNDHGRTGITELKLSNDFVLPLAKHQSLDEHDPIAYLTGNMTKLAPNELMAFQTVVTPISKSNCRSVFRHIDKIRQRIYTNQPLAPVLTKSSEQKVLSIFLAILMGTATVILKILECLAGIVTRVFDDLNHIPREIPVQAVNTRQEILNPYEQQWQEIIKEKIDKQMFEVSLRLFVRADTVEEYHMRTSGFLASLSSFGSPYQTLIENGNLFSFLFSLFPAFSKREITSSSPILSTSELTDIYHFPYSGTTRTEDLVRSRNQPLPAPLSFKQESTHFDNVFARNNYGGTETAIGQTLEERRRHTYILGATGAGKTTLLSAMIYNDIASGKGVAVLDPHGQLVENLMRVIPEERIKDVVWFAPDDDGFPVALNLLELPQVEGDQLTASQLEKQKSLIASSIISIIQKFYDAKYFGPRMEYVLKNAVLTALETERPTLQTVLDLLTKKDYRKEIIKKLKNKQLQDYWVYDFEKLGSLQRNTVISPITNKIGGLLTSPINRNILIQSESSLDFDNIMNSGKILLCDLSKGKIGEDESSFFGSLVIAKIQLAALKRALIPEKDRRDFYLYVDEFQNFATKNFGELVSEARKYRLSTILAHQSISQIEERDIIKVILANVGTVICFRTANPEDEQFILPIFSPEVNKHEIANLSLYNFYMKISVGSAEDSFLAEADNFDVEGSDETAAAVIRQSRIKYATILDYEKKEKHTKQMIQKPVQKVYQSNNSNDTKNKQITGSKTKSSVTYPIQKGSKVGNGKTKINNKQNNSIQSSSIIPTITPQEQQIILLIYRFRFLQRTQIQKYLHHKQHKRILDWLKDLTEKEFIKTINDKSVIKDSKAKIYYLAQNGIRYLSSQDGSDKSALEKFYREKNRTAAFANISLLLADICLDLQTKTNDKIAFKMFVKTDYREHKFKDLLTDLSPHAYIEEKKSSRTKRYFLEIFSDVPTKWLRQRLNKYFNFYQGSEWEAGTQKDFPVVMIVCPNDRVFVYVKHFVKMKLAQNDDSELKIQLTTADKIKEFGLTGDIWKAIH